MRVLEHLSEFSETHTLEHEARTTPRTVAHFCELCYPPPLYHSLSTSFQNFWYWFNNYCFAILYTRYTTVTFNLFVHIFESEPATDSIVSNRLTDFSYRIVGSIKYSEPLPIKLLVYYLINLTIRTSYFKESITERDFRGLQLAVNTSLTDTELHKAFQKHFQQYFLLEKPTAMALEADALKELLTAVLGTDGLDIKRLLNRGGGGNNPRELSLVKVDPFNGTEQEDPYDWIESFKQAAVANHWEKERWPAIAPGYLKEAARDWYISENTEANMESFDNWSDVEQEPDEEGDLHHVPARIIPGFKTKFLRYFTPEVKQNQWYHELMTIRQFANEKVEDYGRRFKKLLRKVNSGSNVVPDILQVRMFLYGLTPMLTPLVATHNPTTLEEAVA